MSKSSKIPALQKKLGAVDVAIENIKQEFDKAIYFAEKTIGSLEGQLEVLAANSSYPGLNFVTLRDVLCTDQNANLMAWTPSFLATVGSGPWEANEFDEFLVMRGFEPVAMPHPSIDGVVIGAQGWSEDDLAEQIYNRDASSLKIYTQELFVVGLILGGDPYDLLDQPAIDEVGFSHPAIQFILNQSFAWPWNAAGHTDDDEDWDVDDTDWAQESALKLLGYSAGAQGPSEPERRRILRVAFEAINLDGVDTPSQRQRWGAARSAKRLHAISHFLGWLLNLQGGKSPEAKQKWTSDLQWLRKSFYQKTMRFVWPVSSGIKSTELNPQAAWPFETNPTATAPRLPVSNHLHSISSSANFYRPSPSLNQITGPNSLTVGNAVKLIRQYISKHNLQDPVTLDVRTDQLLFALSGKKTLKDHELSEVARWHLS